MLALAGANAVGVVLFGTLYALAGAGLIAQPAFVACLIALFVALTVLWVRTEARHRTLDAVRRFGRIAGGLLGVVLVTPVVVLAPLFWLAEQLPPDAGVHGRRGAIMALVLVALVLVALVNVAGALAAVGRALLARRLR